MITTSSVSNYAYSFSFSINSYSRSNSIIHYALVYILVILKGNDPWYQLPKHLDGWYQIAQQLHGFSGYRGRNDATNIYSCGDVAVFKTALQLLCQLWLSGQSWHEQLHHVLFLFRLTSCKHTTGKWLAHFVCIIHTFFHISTYWWVSASGNNNCMYCLLWYLFTVRSYYYIMYLKGIQPNKSTVYMGITTQPVVQSSEFRRPMSGSRLDLNFISFKLISMQSHPQSVNRKQYNSRFYRPCDLGPRLIINPTF